jgi:type II secretory pathway component PulJ
MINYQLSNSKENGFTLLELVVVLSLFMLIMSVTVTMFISIVSHQKRILSQQEMISQLSYVEDYFSRSLRGAITDAY